MEEDRVIAAFYAHDQEELETLSHATSYLCFMYDLTEFVRSKLKYGNEYKTVDEALEAVQDLIYETKNKYHLPE